MWITAHHSVDVHPPVTWNNFKIGAFQWKELLIINKSFLSKAELKDQCICSFKDLRMSEILANSSVCIRLLKWWGRKGLPLGTTENVITFFTVSYLLWLILSVLSVSCLTGRYYWIVQSTVIWPDSVMWSCSVEFCGHQPITNTMSHAGRVCNHQQKHIIAIMSYSSSW